MNNELNFSGKKFISAKRASEISGYTADYIGQLCRLKKLDCRRIGKAWFVGENSLLEHKKNSLLKPAERPVIAPPPKPSAQVLPASYFSSSADPADPAEKPKDEIFYVSAKKASEITGYTQDYVGQLCRSNQLDCKQVGKRWFISELSLQAHKENTAKKERGVIYFPPVVLPKIISQEESSKSLFKKPIFVIPAISFAVVVVLLSVATFNKDIGSRLAFVYQKNSQTASVNDSTKFATDINKRDESISQNNVRTGITVVPSSGDDAKDEKTKEQIKNTFSDQTEVFPDNTGTSGVIKPVFTKLSDQKYLYVMVPVTEQKTK